LGDENVDRVAVFVDAGYLFAQGSVALSGKKLTRSSLVFDHDKAIVALADLGKTLTGLPLLRIYWYDGTSTGPTAQHLSLAHMSGVKVRLGFVNTYGEQKGVDSLIVTDMINLARNRAMSDAVLMSGDEDLRVGVQQAQEFGIRVHLVGIKPSRGSQSLFLLQEADTTLEWGPDYLEPFLSVKPPLEESTAEPAATKAKTATATPLQAVADEVAASVPPPELEALIEAIQKSGQTPRDLDRLLLGKSRTRLGADLDSTQKKEVRTFFLAACERLHQKLR
jgi:uncharacterized LabA/DUF88 family protein